MFNWATPDTVTFLKRGYLTSDETVEYRVKKIARTAQDYLKEDGFAEKLLEYVGKGWISFSSPVWANFGRERGLPISCFGSYIPDTLEGIFEGVTEMAVMSKNGGGTSAFFGDLRHRGAPIRMTGKSDGAVSFMHVFNTAIQVAKQAEVRRGSFAAYLPIDHLDIEEFLQIRRESSTIKSIFPGVSIPDYWMKDVIEGDKSKRMIWAKLLEARSEIGLPYVFFEGNANRAKSQVYKDKGIEIRNSNLCSEILLPVSEDESFVCDLGAVNLRHFDEWKDTDCVAVAYRLLDAIMTEFIDKAENIQHMDKAVTFAKRHRAVGLGVLGFHDYLQEHNIAFEDMAAKQFNLQAFKHIKEVTDAENLKLGEKFGSPEILEGTGLRNATTTAIMPTKSSSKIMNSSQSIEPILSNAHMRGLAKDSVEYRNQNLAKILEEHGKNDSRTWESIIRNDGSVQHLEFLSNQQRNVYKTAMEISQAEIINLAAQRQPYLNQGQSLNLFIHPQTPAKDISKLHIQAWESGLPTLYYQKNLNSSQEFSRSMVDCVSCSV